MNTPSMVRILREPWSLFFCWRDNCVEHEMTGIFDAVYCFCKIVHAINRLSREPQTHSKEIWP